MKKIFFIHVAKTAGSSFSRFLKNNFSGEEHCERFLSENQLFLSLDYLKSLDYLSGHIKLPAFFENGFSLNDYFLLTFLREPNSQVISHLNWVMHIYDVDPQQFLAYPSDIQEICLYLRGQNLYDTDTFIEVVTKLEGLFRNNQSRYFVEDPKTAEELKLIGSEKIIHEILKLDMVGITEHYKESIDLFVYAAGLNIPVQIYRENENNQYRLAKDFLKNDSILNFLHEYNKADHEVYSFFYSRFQAANRILSMIKDRVNLQQVQLNT